MIRGMQLLLACGIILASLPTQVSATIIGPDAFGYTATDEVRPELFFPLGTTLGLTDESYALISSGTFQFPFYGNVYSTFAIGSNGTISFDDALLGFNNKSIPGPSGYSPDQFIAVYWDDLVPTSNVRYTFFGTGASD